jgi:L-lactate dehydrogenase complex protein LldE
MLVRHYPRLLSGKWQLRAEAFARKVFELTVFLDEVCAYQPAPLPGAGSVVYHDACAGLRELGIREQPRRLLAATGTSISELQQRDVCCGFGGTFCAKMPAISAKMADDKIADIENSGAHTVLAGDLGCLLSLAGRARRRGNPLQFRHVAEVLAGDTDSPAIANPEPG